MSATEQRQRYGRGPSRRARWIAAAVAGLCAVAVLGWIAADTLQQGVRWRDVGFDVSQPDRVVVTFDTIMTPDSRAQCRVRALDSGFGEVGTTSVTVGPTRERVTRTSVTLRTTAQAVNGGVADCREL